MSQTFCTSCICYLCTLYKNRLCGKFQFVNFQFTNQQTNSYLGGGGGDIKLTYKDEGVSQWGREVGNAPRNIFF